MSADGGDLEAFAAGRAIPVPVAAIGDELAALWRLAATPGGRTAVTRACLWNLIVHTTAAGFERAKRLVDDVSPTVPARVLVLKTDRAAPTATPRAWIEAYWRSVDGGAHQIGSEEVTLEGDGAAVDDLAAAVRALLVPDVPTAALWSGASPDGASPLDVELLRSADRVITEGDSERDLRSVAALLDEFCLPGCADPIALAWLRAAPWRSLLAGLFDPPSPPGDLFTVQEIAIAGPPEAEGAALLLLGWLGARLGLADGWRSGAGHFAFRGPHGEVGARLELAPGAEAPFSSVTLRTAGGDYGLARSGPAVIHNTPALAWRVPFVAPTEAELLVAALSGRGRDPLYVEALGRVVAIR